MEDIQKAMLDAAYQKELLREYGIGESSHTVIFVGRDHRMRLRFTTFAVPFQNTVVAVCQEIS